LTKLIQKYLHFVLTHVWTDLGAEAADLSDDAVVNVSTLLRVSGLSPWIQGFKFPATCTVGSLPGKQTGTRNFEGILGSLETIGFP
jgi:hypothetical protein